MQPRASRIARTYVIVVLVLARKLVLVTMALGKVDRGAVQIENVGMEFLEAVEVLGLDFAVFSRELLTFNIRRGGGLVG
jgi:hypothetical protein